MRHLKLYLSLLLLATFVMVGCSDDFDRPPMDIPTAKDKPNMSILDLKTKYWDDAKNYIDTIKTNDNGEPIVISGRVISSDATGNIYKTLVIQDESAAIAISINANSLYTSYRVGQEIVMPVTDMFIGKFNTLQQLGYPEWYASGNTWEATFMSKELFEAHAQLNGLPDLEKIDTITTTIGELPSTPEGLRKMQSQLVRFDNVKFVDADGKTPYSESASSTSRNIQDLSGNTLAVRNSNYATFRAEALPLGVGSVVGILSYYSGSWQLLLRSTEDCIGFSNDTKGLNADDPFTMEDVLKIQNTGRGGWMTGFIVGAVAPAVTEVKSNDDIEWTAPTALANSIVIGATKDTKDIKNCIVVELKEGMDLRKYGNLMENPSVLGKQIWLNASTYATVLGTYGAVTSGAVADFKIDGVDTGGSTGGGSGAGTKEAPYSIAQVLDGSASGTGKWISGYIVGWVDGMTLSTGATFTTPATSSSNILLADAPNTTDVTKCIPVQLPAGTIRTALNLVDHPDNLGKQVALCGEITSYFGSKGLKSASDMVFDGGDTPVVDTTPVTTLDESFASGIPANWTNKAIQGTNTWFQKTYNSDTYASVTGYKGTAPFDIWLITPALNVKEAATKILSFDTENNNYSATTSEFEVYVLNSNDPATATTKTKLSCTLAPKTDGSYSAWTNSGNIDLSSYGDKVYVGFRYTATQDANYATWCLTKVKFGL